MPSKTQSESDGTSELPEPMELAAEKPSSDYTLYIGVHRFRAVAGTLMMAIVVIGAMLPFARDGIRVSSFQAGDLDTDKQKKMLDKYNSVSGGLTVLLTKPLDVFLSMVVTITFLFQCTQRASGFRRDHPRIISSDLAVVNVYDTTQQLDDQGLLSTTWDTRFRENTPGNSVLNTILRKLFLATEEVSTWCNQTDDYPDPFKSVITNYGFPPRSWQQYALSQALEPTATLSMPMNAATSDLPQNQDLPMNESIATNLAVYAILVSNSFLGWWRADNEAWNRYSPVSSSEALSMADHFNLTTRSLPNATFVSDVHERIVDYFTKAENASVTDKLAKVEFSHVDMSDNILFDALTIEIPTLKYGEQEDNSSSSNPFYQRLHDYLCNSQACLMPDAKELTEDGTETTIYPRVQALAICLNDAGGEELVVDFKYYEPNQILQSCKQRSNTSMIIVSVGKRIEGDSLEPPGAGAAVEDAAQVVNARMVYSLTVGRLSWTLENLRDTYGAECASENGCLGIRFPLESTHNSSFNDHLLVSQHSIPTRSLSPINLNRYWFSVGTSQWTILASTMEETRGAALPTETRPALVVLPRNFKRADTSFTNFMKEYGWGDCEIFIDKHINHVEKNHLYIEHTLQPAYTAGLYFIFQNAVVLKQLPSNASVDSTKTSLDFLGNIQEMNVQASIPTTNMLLAIAGCIFVVLAGIIIAVLGKRGEGELLEHGTARTAAEVISNPDKFPPFMLRLQLRDRIAGDMAETSLDSLHIKHVVLVKATDDNEHFVVGG
ncbi:hypothetical protein PC120_g3736 [Phytophthora cactorum]|nr:hypothetical protein PC120_g3736 [Phytophthora cactorum]